MAEGSPGLAHAVSETPADRARSGRLQRERRSGLAQKAGALIRHDPVVLVALIVLAVFGGVALAAPALALPDPLVVDSDSLFAEPGTPGHPLGTDELGRDVLSRLIWGARTSLLMPVVPLLGAIGVGGLLGLLAGYFGRWTDTLIMRALDVLLAFPSVLLAIGIAAALGPGLNNALLAIGIVEIPTFARLVRAVTLSARHFDYVQAARSLGASDWQIVGRHVLPNAIAPVVVYGTLGFGRVIILASSLSFLGLGIQLPAPDWGSMLDAGRKLMLLTPHVATVPGLAILLVTLSVNILGDLLRDTLDPRTTLSGRA